MSRDLFMVILRGVRDYDPYFQCRPDATGALGFTSYQKCSAAIRMLPCGMTADIFDEYLRMSESTCLESMYRFCRAVIVVFGQHYCREPTVEVTRRLLSINESRGFPGMIGSIDCMHWEWKNCPFGWQVFNRLMQGKAPRMSYEVNENEYDKPYYLANGIYPDWATLVKTVRNPNSEKTRRFAKMQEACRKDVERGFGVLQARWAIVRHPARTWSLKTMHNKRPKNQSARKNPEKSHKFYSARRVTEPEGPGQEAQGLLPISRRGQEGGPTLWCGPLGTPPTLPLRLYNLS
ncbi:hypothetical protein QYE76_005754 [Lolium multiflorum]|uniref:Uncharacterized protein n=1 Tax=Lolium multiflorum TaxID=4521 RepID=A0AAD8RVD0_LOLMU|nr:hypothetical protein QYE76_005754 [Lolium multiflorum]